MLATSAVTSSVLDSSTSDFKSKTTVKSLDLALHQRGIHTTNIGDRKAKENLLDSINKRDTKYPFDVTFDDGNLTEILTEKRKIFDQDKGA